MRSQYVLSYHGRAVQRWNKLKLLFLLLCLFLHSEVVSTNHYVRKSVSLSVRPKTAYSIAASNIEKIKINCIVFLL